MMARRKKVFCEYSFWTEFVASRDSLFSINERALIESQTWIQFWRFLVKSNLVFDISIQQFNIYKQTNPTLSDLWKKVADGNCSIDFMPNSFPDINDEAIELKEDQLNAIYLTTASEEQCEKTSAKLGIVVLNPSMAKKSAHLFNDNGVALPDYDRDIKSWCFLESLNEQSPKLNNNNALILVDNYVVNKEEKSIKHNILEILDIVMPKRLNGDLTYYVTIFSSVNNDKEKERCKKLIEDIKALRSSQYKTKACFIHVQSSDFHDRTIITNNVWIGCGHGFDIFQKGRLIHQSTTVNVIFPFLQSSIKWAEKAYYNLLDDAQRIMKRSHRHGFDYWGDVDYENRLTKYLSSEPVASSKDLFSASINKTSSLKVVGILPLSALTSR